MTSQHAFQAGYASVDYTPAPGLPLQGQMHVRIATGARDPLEACAIAVRQDETTVVIVTADVCGIDVPFVNEVQAAFEEQTGVPGTNLLLQATHTHDAPAAIGTIIGNYRPEFAVALKKAIIQSAVEAVANLEPSEVFSGTGHLEHMGWNRRAMFDDGTTRMYGHSEMPGFIGMEGPRDPALPVLFTRNLQGEITGILVSFATHPNSIESETVYSADVPGAVRRHLRKIFGENIGVVYLTGAAGDTAPSILDPLDEAQPWRGDEGLERSGQYLAAEAAKVIASCIKPIAEPIVALHRSALQIPLRTWPQPGEPGRPPADNFGPDYYAESEANWPVYSAENSPLETRVNVLRIGDTALCTNPAELFVDFGLQMRAASPARVTLISELTDGYVGYVPTPKAFERGGYETWCAPSSPLEFSAGDQIVAATKELLDAAF
jgi:neutral ceramidase